MNYFWVYFGKICFGAFLIINCAAIVPYAKNGKIRECFAEK